MCVWEGVGVDRIACFEVKEGAGAGVLVKLPVVLIETSAQYYLEV